MFNNRQTRRRFQLGNLARLLQLRQSVSHQSPPPSEALQETLSQSSPQLQPATTLPLPLSPKSNEKSQSQPTPPPSPPESGESQPQPLTLVFLPPLTPEAKTPPSLPSTLNTNEVSQSHHSPPLQPFKSIDESRFQSMPLLQASPPSLSVSGESQPPLPTPKAKTPPSSNLNNNENFKSQKSPSLLPGKFINDNRFQSSSPSQASPPLLSDSGEFQSPLRPPKAKTPPSSPSTLNANEEFQSQQAPPPPPHKSINETRFQSSTPSQVSPPSLSESGGSKSPLPPPKAKIPMTPQLTLDASGESQPQPPPPARPIDENRSLSPPISSADSAPPSKSIEEHKSTPPSPDSKSLTHSSPPPSPLLSPKPSENPQSQSRKLPQSPTALRSPSPQKYSPMKAPIPSRSASQATNTAPPSSPPKSPPSISSPLKSQKIPSPKPSLPQIEPNPIKYHSPKPRNTESHSSPDHNKGENENLETEITGKMNENKENPVAVMMMFVNSNVQGIVSSLSLDSSSIDHEPGVHFTIDYHQTCDFSSTFL